MSLPTYEDTVKGPNKLTLVAPYFDRVSLLAASRVCKEWHSIFMAELWSDPIKVTAQTRTPFGMRNLIFTDFANNLYSQDPSLLYTFE
jgi:hypothetical protein